MRFLLWLVLAVAQGCALLPDKRTLQEAGLYPSRTEPFCYPRGKLEHERRRVYLGVGCRF